MKKSIVFLAALIMCFAGCGQGPEQNEGGENVIQQMMIAETELFIDFEEGGLIAPTDIEVLENGNIAVLDVGDPAIRIYNAEGTLLSVVGRTGEGPGEYTMPQRLESAGSDVLLVDGGKQKILRYGAKGEFLSSYNYKRFGRFSDQAPAGNDVYYTSAMAEDGALIRKVFAESDSSILMGTNDISGEFSYDLGEANEQLKQGQVPDIEKYAVTISPDDGDVFVFSDAYRKAWKFSNDGKLLWEQEVEHPVFDAILSELTERAKEIDQPGVMASYAMISGMNASDDELFLLSFIHENHGRFLFRISEQADKTVIYALPKDSPQFYRIAADLQSGRIFLTSPTTGQVYRAELSRATMIPDSLKVSF